MRLLYDRKQPYYCEVEYLENSSMQYIDTRYYPNNNTKVEFMASGISADSFSLASTGTWLFGSRQAYAQNMYGAYYVPNTQKMTFNYGENVNSTSVASSLVYGDKRKFYLDSTGLYIDDVKRITPSAQSAFTSPATMTLFALNNNGTVISFTKYKIHYWKMWDGDTLVRNMIPVLNWDMTPCMYDKVTGQLLYNSGTGAFLYGREIHPVEYIKGTGTQYFDSGVATSTTIITECTCQYDPNAEYEPSIIFGSGTEEDVNTDRYQGVFSTAGMAYSARLDGGARVLNGLNVMVKRTVRVDPIAKRFYVDATSGPVAYSGSINSNNIYFFARSMNAGETMPTPTKMLFYDAKQWDGDLLIRDFIPAIDKTGKAFAFDKVEHTIHDNIGTGEFLYGKVKNTSGLRLLYTSAIPGSDKKYMLRFLA